MCLYFTHALFLNRTNMKKSNLAIATILTFAVFGSPVAHATIITATDLDSLSIGAKIVGPVGPDVEVSLINADGNSVGDLRSSVSCPDGFTTCAPPNNPAGTIYTYTHTVTPGIDNPNDAPFPNPPIVLAFDDVIGFSLGFEAVGFNGVAGYSFNEATNADISFDLELTAPGELIWSTNSDGWDTGEAITFFWQTTQPPSGPGGIFNISNAGGTASGRGPLPTALPVPEPMALGLILVGLIGLTVTRQKHI